MIITSSTKTWSLRTSSSKGRTCISRTLAHHTSGLMMARMSLKIPPKVALHYDMLHRRYFHIRWVRALLGWLLN